MKFKLPLNPVFKTVDKIIGKKENEHYVNFIFPDAGLGGPIMNFIAKYVLQQEISSRAGNYSNEVLGLYNGLVKYFYDGMPIAGKLTITNDDILFKPWMYQAIFMKGCKQVIVPTADISAVSKGSKWLGTYEFIVVTTIHGEFKCVIMPGYLGSTMGEDMCSQIQKAMKFKMSPGSLS